jgi:chromosome partitioning protein
MIVALLNQPHGVGKMTLALHPAGLWSYRTRHVTVIDADPQGRTLEWSEMWAQERMPSRFTVIGLTRNTLHRDAPNIARDVDRVIVDGLCHVAALSRGALLTVDLVLVPVRLPRFVRAAFAETFRLVNEANTFRPRLRTRIVLNRRDAHDVDAHEIAQALAKCDPPVLTSCIGRRAVLAEAVVTGRLAFEMAHSAAVRKITALAAEVESMAR